MPVNWILGLDGRRIGASDGRMTAGQIRVEAQDDFITVREPITIGIAVERTGAGVRGIREGAGHCRFDKPCK